MRLRTTAVAVKPRVFKIGSAWGAVLVRGFEGNYEHDWVRCATWREAFDWAYDQAVAS